MYVFSYFPFGFEGRIWDLIVSVPDHCLSFYFEGVPWVKDFRVIGPLVRWRYVAKMLQGKSDECKM